MNNKLPPVLDAFAIEKTFPSGPETLSVLRDVNLSVAAGESVSIRGESGSGKSTLLHLLAGLDMPDSGELLWEGHRGLNEARRAKFLGIVFQSFYLMPELTAFDNVLMAARVVGGVGEKERARAAELLKRVGLEGRMSHVPAKLSGGERQRVAVARALMNEPRLVLADEPTGNLDERTGEGIIDLLMGVCAESATALVLVTHNAHHAARCARQLVLHDGVLRAADEA